ncbi:MAG: TVP38/TMEM64 family protein [Chloroflexi bacterium]|nr:TVP38/TMEM64 family protein [Chloroflexota bacterium]
MMRKAWRQVLAGVVLLALITGGIFLWQSGRWAALGDRQALQEAARSFGPWGAAILFLAEVAQVLLAPFPGQAVGLAAGYFYGLWAGTALAMAGLMTGTALALWLGRTLGRPLVERLANPALIARLDGYLERRGEIIFLAIFLLPFLPDDLCCFVAGLSKLPLRRLWLVALLGRLPGVLITAYLGDRSQRLGWPQFAALLAGLCVLGVLLAGYRQRVQALLFRVLDRWVRR